MISKPSVAFYTLGCKLNFSETSTITRDFKSKEYELVSFDTAADIYVINTCSVTDKADKRFKHLVRETSKRNPDAFIIAIGCYAQLNPKEVASIDNVDLVLGANEKFKITDYIQTLQKKDVTEVHSCEIDKIEKFDTAYSYGDRIRGFLKIQDGCDYKCTYCTIPVARGISRSDTLNNVVKNARILSSKGIKEIVLTGVNIGDYGKGEFQNKNHLHTFYDLVNALDKTTGIQRVRISSIEPNLLNDDIIELVSLSDKFVPHFHIPLQSGSNVVLKKMKRRYNRELYTNRVNKIKKSLPTACIGVDVIVGFPGETDEMFMETYQYLSTIDISYLHVFSYSERPNTKAIELTGKVGASVRAKRSKMLRGLSVKKRRAFYESQLGQVKTILLEAENKNGYMYGFSENYIKVKTVFKKELVNTLHPVFLTKIDEDGIVLFDWIS